MRCQIPARIVVKLVKYVGFGLGFGVVMVIFSQLLIQCLCSFLSLCINDCISFFSADEGCMLGFGVPSLIMVAIKYWLRCLDVLPNNPSTTNDLIINLWISQIGHRSIRHNALMIGLSSETWKDWLCMSMYTVSSFLG